LRKTVGISVVLGALAGCAHDHRVLYRCENGERVLADFRGEEARIILERGDRLTLRLAASASGARYTDGTTTFWTKGREAFLERGSVMVHRHCGAE
jgi:membrane-bound inhibitor of C-type lysozyme